jgi:hypothetical protein
LLEHESEIRSAEQPNSNASLFRHACGEKLR